MRKIELLHPLQHNQEMVTITEKCIKPAAAIKQIATLGLRTMQPDDFNHIRSYEIPGRVSIPDIEFTCNEEDFNYFRDRFNAYMNNVMDSAGGKDDVLASYENDTYEIHGFFMYDGPDTFSPGCVCTGSVDYFMIV